MERQRAPPKGREAENGSRGIDSRGRIPESVHIAWATGGRLVPEEIRREYQNTYLEG